MLGFPTPTKAERSTPVGGERVAGGGGGMDAAGVQWGGGHCGYSRY